MVLQRFDLSGRAAVVTGAGRGLGEQMAYALARAGADVVCAARTQAQIERAAASVRALGRRALAVPTDVRDSAQCDRLVQRCVEELGTIDIMLANAGIGDAAGEGVPPTELSDEAWQDTLTVNLSSAFYCARAAARWMREHGGGVIITVASGTGLRGFPQDVGYGAAKAGVIALTKSLALAWARDRIRVNCIVPGFVAQAPPADDGEREELARRGRFIPVGRLGEAPELGPLAVFLASEAASYVTGEIFILDGGGLTGGIAPTGYAPLWPAEG